MEARIKRLMEKDKIDLVKLLIETEDQGVNATRELMSERYITRILVVKGFLKQEIVNVVREYISMVNNGTIKVEDLIKELDAQERL